MEGLSKKNLIRRLKEDILFMEGFRRPGLAAAAEYIDLGPMNTAFPAGTFPTGAVHEFISPTASCATAANAFICGLLPALIRQRGQCLWISTGCSLFPPALVHFGLVPHEVIFVQVKADKEALWVMEQALKCQALAAVVAELTEVSFSESRRLQLSVENSKVTGLLHRRRPRWAHQLASVSRFRIRPIASHTPAGMPGVGHPRWEVQLEKIRNGTPGTWVYEWRSGGFMHVPAPATDREAGWRAKKEQYA